MSEQTVPQVEPSPERGSAGPQAPTLGGGAPARPWFRGARCCGEGGLGQTPLQEGFTLLELIIVMAVIGILAAIAMPMLKDTPRRANEAVLRTNLHSIRDALDQYHGDKGHYPPSLETLVEQGYFRTVPVDPITDSSETWVLIYEEIDPELEPAETDLPEGGEPGVYDVRSGSELTALDGSLYSEW